MGAAHDFEILDFRPLVPPVELPWHAHIVAEMAIAVGALEITGVRLLRRPDGDFQLQLSGKGAANRVTAGPPFRIALTAAAVARLKAHQRTATPPPARAYAEGYPNDTSRNSRTP
jgi:hypothetical protein